MLLVEPTADGNFQAVAGHGHGLFWSGNMLVVATGGSVLRVFDLRHLWRTDTSTGEVGLGADGKYHALWHAFALPQIGAYWYAGGRLREHDRDQALLRFSLGIDHGGTGSFVAVEHTTKGGGRIVRWPLDESTGLLRAGADGVVHAVEAFDSPVWGMQGATRTTTAS